MLLLLPLLKRSFREKVEILLDYLFMHRRLLRSSQSMKDIKQKADYKRETFIYRWVKEELAGMNCN